MMVDWPAAELTEYEAAMRPDGPIVVLAHDGCHFHVLRGCHAPGRYSYTGTGGRQESIALRSAAELSAKLNFWGPNFSAEFSKTNEVELDLFLNGEYRAPGAVIRNELQGVCQYATHALVAMQVGASILHSASATTGGGGAGYGPASLSGSAVSSANVLARSCPSAKSPFECIDPVRVEIVSIVDQTAMQCPAGTTWDGANCSLPMEQRSFALTVNRITGAECRVGGGCEYHLYLHGVGQDAKDTSLGQRTGARYSPTFDFNWRVAHSFPLAELARGLDLSIWHDGDLGEKKMGTCSLTATAEELRTLDVGKTLERNMVCADSRKLTFQFVREH